MRGYRWVWNLGLASGLLALSLGCHSGGKGPNREWLRVSLARSVDLQFGPVITHDPPSDSAGDGSHEGDLLRGQANLGTLTQVVQYLTEQLLVPADPPGNIAKLNRYGPNLSKLERMAAVSVNSNPCRQDSDNDGVPDIKEDVNDGGLCTSPAAVTCKVHADNSFTVKFSHCIPVTTDFVTPWSPEVVSTVFTPNAHWTHTFSSGSTFVGRSFVYRLTNTTTNGTVINPTLAITPSMATSARPSWGTGTVGCSGGTILNYSFTTHPPLYRITATTSDSQTVDLIYDGAITLELGAAGVDEQVMRVSYNKFTRIWGDAQSGTTDNSRYLTLDGQSMQYRVMTPTGAPAPGTTPVPAGFGDWTRHQDGMEIEKYRVTFDPDGKAGPLPAGNYRVARGMDFEDGRFFMNADGQIVSLKDKNGPDPADLLSSPALGINVDGVRVLGATPTTITFALNFYDANNPLGDGLPGNGAGQACGKPYSNTRCRVEVTVNPWFRTFEVVDLDPAACAKFWDWTPTNQKYKNLPF